ncbi:hypothetical protein [Gordonia humi]|uniref:Alkaline shock response membrane anchor protein AmaP n=1 Tax=Gordonia humi TaxID=686429 RepID=A0A840EMY9_9ACTN|nr:hypothetical protein [Gordonia humi]MBB4134165.1 hypothetical protein [Gordonia humi]
MNRLPAVLHRLSTGLIGLVLVVIGAVAVLWNIGVSPVVDALDRVDNDAVGRFADSGWWTLVLVGIVVLTLVWALPLIVSAVRPGAVDDLDLAGSDETGTMNIAPKLIASAVADELSGDPMFTAVSARALDDRARSIIRLEVTANSVHTYPEVAERVGAVTDQIREAVAGADVHVQAFVHLEKIKR